LRRFAGPGLKPRNQGRLDGTAKAVPLQKRPG